MAAHRLVFAISPVPLAILVTFITGDDHKRLSCTLLPDSLQNMDRPHHISCIGPDRILVGGPYQRLCGHVEYDIGSHGLEACENLVRLSDVEKMGLETIAGNRQRGEAWIPVLW